MRISDWSSDVCSSDLECGMLPGALLRNAHLKFVCRFVHLRVETSDSAFTRGYNSGDVIRVPVAHHDGNYVADPETRSEARRGGKEGVRMCSYRWSTYPYKKHDTTHFKRDEDET